MNLTMLMDFYELTMSKGYFDHDMQNRIAYFDMFYRKTPDKGGYAIMAGVEQLIGYLKTLSFEDEDIEFLRSKRVFDEAFLEYLKNFKFKADVWAIPEGTPIFPGEPIVTVKGTAIEAQLVETMVLLTINHQSLIATKATRIVRAAQGRPVMEFGSRRAQGYDGAIFGARAAYIGGCVGTACTICERDYGIPALGTMAHSWVQMFDSEYDAFCAYAKAWPDNCALLVDTYNVLKSGIPNAIRAFNDILIPMGLGLLIGGILFLKIVEILFSKYRTYTYFSIIGFTLGSIFVLFPGFNPNLLNLFSILLMCICFFLSYKMSLFEKN